MALIVNFILVFIFFLSTEGMASLPADSPSATPPLVGSGAPSPAEALSPPPSSGAPSPAVIRKHLTLLFLVDGDRVLLGMKKRGFGKGKMNGFGGKIDPGESILAGAEREMLEESGLRVLDAQYRAFLVFEFEGSPERLEVHAFLATKYEGEPVESEEMAPAWTPISALPFERMWLDDAIWLRPFLGGRTFRAHFLFRGHEAIVSHEITDIDRAVDLADAATTVLIPAGASKQGSITS